MRRKSAPAPPDDTHPDLEARLRLLAVPLDPPRPGEWLAEHREKGQTFRQYLAANPVRRGPDLSAIHVCRIGEFDDPQARVVEEVQRFLGLFFDVPVHFRRHVPFDAIPAEARRKHPTTGDRQLLTGYVLHDLLEPDRPADALAYVALTARDLWPGDGWNFVFGQANLRRRVAVFSLARGGYPGRGAGAFRLCLRRTALIAAHELGHVLTMQHCTAFRCLMNGCNSQDERDAMPLSPCPVCLRKLCWNLGVEPATHLRRLEAWSRGNGLTDAETFAHAAALVDSSSVGA
jgi:archaemetzincin